MDPKAGTWLIAPSVRNSSCSHPRFTGSLISHIGPGDIIQSFLVLSLTIGIIGANLLVIIVINSRRYAPYIHPQPRYLLTSLALNDLAIGLLITPFGLLPALLHCWPYGEIFCQIQALLRGALSQQSAVILVCMAVDRYLCALHPQRYHQHSSKKGCVAILSLTWILSLSLFGVLVLPKGYYFNSTGLLVCEPFYSKPSYRILSTCALYFPTTMVLMYCYGSSFHASRFRFAPLSFQQQQMQQQFQHQMQQQMQQQIQQQMEQQIHQQIQHQMHQQFQTNQAPSTINGEMAIIMPTSNPNTATSSAQTGITATEKMVAQERRLSGSASRTMAAMSLGFIVMVTPWTIQEVVAACTGSKVPPFLDFFVTWTALSNSFWNPFLYWLLNAHFRRISRELLSSKWCSGGDGTSQKSRCCSISSECDPISLPMPPGPPSSRPPRPDVEGLSEKYWGEILERTVSSNSLHVLQRTYGQPQLHEQQQQGINASTMCLTIREQTGPLSNSEPRLCEPVKYHDINCAKNKTYLNSLGDHHHLIH